jgi:transglutaminase-like putative cysteine protease
MDREHAAKGPGGRLVLLTAVLALVLVATVAFARVFQGTGTTLRLALVAAASVLLAAAMERRHILLATLVSAAGLAVVIGLLLYPETTRYWLPTASTWRAALKSWDAVGRAADTEVAPALPLVPLMLASVVAVWAAAFATHALAVRASSPFLALLPTGALVAFASLVVDDGARPLYVIAFLAAAMLLLYADGLRRVSQWGPISEWHGRHRFRLGTTASLRGARRVALIALVVAVFLPGILPGYGSPAIVQVNGDGSLQRLTSNPIVDIRPALLRKKSVEVFTVRSSQGAYWRSLTLDTFDGETWRTTDPYLEKSGTDYDGGRLSDAKLPTAPSASKTNLHQEITYERLSQPWVVSAYQATSMNISDAGDMRYDPDTGTTVMPDGAPRGLTYRVDSRIVTPTPDQLGKISVQQIDPSIRATNTQLPYDTPSGEQQLAQIRAIAEQITAGQPDMYHRVLAIQDYLRRFRYDLNVSIPPGVDPVLWFLQAPPAQGGQAGYCVQFASTMAALLRSLGIPARLAMGWTPGRFDPSVGVWRVTNFESHVWVEVPFAQYGWLPFEPTPRAEAVNPQAISFQHPLPPGPTECTARPDGTGRPASCQGGAEVPNPVPTPTTLPTLAPPTTGPPGHAQVGGPEVIQVPRSLPSRLPWWLFALVGLLRLVAIPVTKVIRRRVLVSRADQPRERVLVAYRLMSERAGDVGLRREPSETLWEYRSRLRDRVRFSEEATLDRLTALAGKAAYSDDEIGTEEAGEAVRASREATSDITRSAGVAGRAAGWFRVRIPSWRG